ncbi:MAG: hypothetical protein EA378_06250 [Phycisphaerales bacterium]|nr:MAG: hypothetical protein EA378_06250 [Phycisphaerales bacterium]
MPRDEMYDDGPSLDEGLDPEGPSAADLERFGDEYVTCPNCGSSVYDQAEACARCGHMLMSGKARQTSIWTWLIVALILIAFFGLLRIF